LKDETGFDRVEVGVLDLGSFESVKKFAQKINEDNVRLDLLMENAGIAPEQYEVTKDGWKLRMYYNLYTNVVNTDR